MSCHTVQCFSYQHLPNIRRTLHTRWNTAFFFLPCSLEMFDFRTWKHYHLLIPFPVKFKLFIKRTFGNSKVLSCILDRFTILNDRFYCSLHLAPRILVHASLTLGSSSSHWVSLFRLTLVCRWLMGIMQIWPQFTTSWLSLCEEVSLITWDFSWC